MKKTSAKILVVDDDPEIVEILKYNLSNSFIEKGRFKLSDIF